MKKRNILLGAVVIGGLLIAGCGKEESAKSGAVGAADNKNVEALANETEDAEKAAEKEEVKDKNLRDVTKLSLEERRELFIRYSEILDGASDNYILCNEDGTVTVTGYYYNDLTEPWEWTDISQVVAMGDYVMGLKKDGTVDVGELYEGESEYPYTDAEQWTDIVQIAGNPIFCSGLKKDGTVVWTSHEELEPLTQPAQISEWKDIKQIASFAGLLFGLKSDGTVVFNHYDEEVENGTGAMINEIFAPVEEWTNVRYLTAATGTIAGLTEDGKVLYVGLEIEEEGGSDPATWENVVGITAASNLLVGLLEDGTIVGSGELDDLATEYSNVSGLCCDDSGEVVAITYDGRLLGNDKYFDSLREKRDEIRLESFVQHTQVVGVDSNGSFLDYSLSDQAKEVLSTVTGACDLINGAGSFLVLRADGHVEPVDFTKPEENIWNVIRSWEDIQRLALGDKASYGAVMGIDSEGQGHFIDANGNTSPVLRYTGPSVDMVSWNDVAIELKPEGVVHTHDIQGAKGTYKHPDVSDWQNIEAIYKEENTLFGVDSDGNTRCVALYFSSINKSKVDTAAAEQNIKNAKDICVSAGTVAAVNQDGEIMVSDPMNTTMGRLLRAWEGETIKEVKTMENGNIVALTEDGRLLETVLTGVFLAED